MSRWRLSAACSCCSRPLTASLSLSSDSRPSDFANASSTVTAPGASTDFAVTSNSASLPASCGVHIVRGKRDLDPPRLAGAHADELILEAGDEGPGADIDADITAGAAFERRAVERAGEVDDHAVALFGLGALAFGGERPVLLGDLVERLLDLRVGNLRDLTLELDAVEIGELDLRQNLQRDRIGEVGLARR